MQFSWIATVLGLLLATPALAQRPTADELVRKYDAVMGPTHFDGTTTMTAHREDGSTRSYKMRVLKKGDDLMRVWFDEPAAVRGQEMLRNGDNLWVYMPNLKRALRLANRDSFQGGDFNNADVLRVNYQVDYTATLAADAGRPDAWLLELKGKTRNASYDAIKLWLRKADSLPIKGEFYSASGKLLRAAEYSEIRDFGGVKRPAKVKMKNMLNTARHSTLTFLTLDTKVEPASGRFRLDDLGR